MRFLETIFSSQLEMLREKINPLGQLCNTFPLLLRNMLSLVCSVSLDSVWHHWLGVFKGALLLLLTGFDYISTSRLWKLCLNPYVFEGDTPVQNFFFACWADIIDSITIYDFLATFPQSLITSLLNVIPVLVKSIL